MIRNDYWMIVLVGAALLALSLSAPVATWLSAEGLLAPKAARPADPKPASSQEAQREKPAQQTGSRKEAGGNTKAEQSPPAEAAAQEPVQLAAQLVTVPVVVFDKKGHLYTKLKKENFTVYEDGVKQQIATFANGAAPLTMVMVIEYSRIIEYIRDEVINPIGIFASRFVKPGDYVAIVAYDMRPKVLTDFTDSPGKLLSAVNLLIRNLPAFSEADLYDTLKFVLEGGTLDGVDYKGLSEIKGRTSVLLVATGIDTFSRINYGEARRIVANAGVPIYSIGVGEVAYIQAEPYLSGVQRMTFLEAQNALRTFSETSGGRFYSVRFEGELPSVLQSISTMVRNEYVLGYTPTNPRRKGKKRKIKLLVDVDGDGKPDNKDLVVQYRRSYVEPKS